MVAMLLIFCACLVQCAAFRGHCSPGAPCEVLCNDSSVLQVALSAAHVYNDRSDDSFLFRASSIWRAQKQVVRGVRYIVDLDLSRTVCWKRDQTKDLQDCAFQPPGVLHQVFRCHIEAWVVPWTKHSTTQQFFCKTLSFAHQEGVVSISTNQKTAESATANHKAAESVSANQEAAESVSANQEAAESVSANQEAAESVSANQEAAESVSANQEAAESVSVNQEVAESVSTNQEAAESVSANQEAAVSLSQSGGHRVSLSQSGGHRVSLSQSGDVIMTRA